MANCECCNKERELTDRDIDEMICGYEEGFVQICNDCSNEYPTSDNENLYLAIME
jgi:hypothetical protein